jgi:hypothetical protein
MGDVTEYAGRERRSVLETRIRHAAEANNVPRSRGGEQLRSISADLAKSVCLSALVETDERFADDGFANKFVEEQSDRIGELLSALPSAFHNWPVKTKDGATINPFNMKVPELEKVADNVEDVSREALFKAYGTVWKHVRALSEIRPDAPSELRRDLMLHAWKDGVEDVAYVYLAADDFASPLLECAIVDALVLDRIVGFASACSFTGNLPGFPDSQTFEGPLLPGTGRFPMLIKQPTPFGLVGMGLTEIAGKIAIELAILGVTWWGCGLLAGTEGLAKWILFTGVTAGRWVTEAVRKNGEEALENKAKGKTNLQMLWDMGIAHERVPAMNVGLLKHLFYRLEERGAAFSPTVYAILDKRARRESAKG